jgi:fructose-bisphosphate aldolase class II
MKSLREIIDDAESRKIAVGHFNVSELTALKAIVRAAREVGAPLIIGVSEGEREFIGLKQIAALIRSFRSETDAPIFLNADHTYSLERIKAAVEAGFDAVIFDGAKLSFAENVARTKAVVNWVKSVRPEVLVEGELGYIGTSSKILDSLPEGAALTAEQFTKPEEAQRFVEATGVDLLAPAVGNIHGLLAKARTQINADSKQIEADNISVNPVRNDISNGVNQPNDQGESASMVYMNPPLDIQRIRDIKRAVKIPLVLHGGSGIQPQDLKAAIEAGISVIHINTEIRAAWREGLTAAFLNEPNEVAPYKLLALAEERIYQLVLNRLRLFSGK